VFGGEGLAGVVGGHEGLGRGEVAEAQVGGVAVLGPGHDVGDVGCGRSEVQDGGCGDPVPLVPGGRRAACAVQVGDDRDMGKCGQIVEDPLVYLARGGGAEDTQVPAFGPEPGDRAVVGHGPPVHMALAGGMGPGVLGALPGAVVRSLSPRAPFLWSVLPRGSVSVRSLGCRGRGVRWSTRGDRRSMRVAPVRCVAARCGRPRRTSGEGACADREIFPEVADRERRAATLREPADVVRRWTARGRTSVGLGVRTRAETPRPSVPGPGRTPPAHIRHARAPGPATPDRAWRWALSSGVTCHQGHRRQGRCTCSASRKPPKPYVRPR